MTILTFSSDCPLFVSKSAFSMGMWWWDQGEVYLISCSVTYKILFGTVCTDPGPTGLNAASPSTTVHLMWGSQAERAEEGVIRVHGSTARVVRSGTYWVIKVYSWMSGSITGSWDDLLNHSALKQWTLIFMPYLKKKWNRHPVFPFVRLESTCETVRCESAFVRSFSTCEEKYLPLRRIHRLFFLRFET